MVGSQLFVLIIAASFTFTFSAVVDSNSNVHPKFQRRTWDEAIAMAKAFVTQLSLEEKCNMTGGVAGPCVGNVFPVPRLNFNGMCYQDSPSGVGDGVLHSTAFAAGIHIAATWDRDLFYQRGAAIGKEFQGKGVHFALGPMMNIDRNARHGRNWEGFGSDPYLSGENAYGYVIGLQDQGVVATAKHYICNEQETNRVSMTSDTTNGAHPYSAYLDDKTIHEIYLWPFAASVAAGVGSIMCSYNQVNGTQACENNKTLNGLLKGELGFSGNVMSDWGATHSGAPSALGGLDIDMPRGGNYLGYALLDAVKNGTVPESRVNDMAIRIMTPYYLLGQDQGYPSLDLDRDATGDNYMNNRQVASAGMILLKNTNNALPLNGPNDTYLYIYGAAAGQSDEGYRAASSAQHGGALYQGGGSGYVNPTYGIDPLTALMMRGRDSHLQIRYITNQNDYGAINGSFHDRGFNNAKCLVFISAFSSEGSDRRDLLPANNGSQLVQTVAANCPKTIVIVNSVSQLNLEPWVDLPNVVGVLWTGMPGSEYGPAIVDVLFGDYNPGGKLVFTLAKNDSDYGTDVDPGLNSTYAEGVFLDYRHFDQFNITPRYYFGYGLSYTTFSFVKLDISKARNDIYSTSSQFQQRRMKSYSNFDSSSLYDPAYVIKFTLTNTGKVNGSEVPQLYLGFPAEAEEPPKILRGFERVYLAAGESKEVALTLTQLDISYWNAVNQKWTVAPGDYTVWVSTSANNADVKLQGSFHI
jgi:beta-glucosidase